MKKLKDEIAEGEALLKKYKDILAGIAKLPRPEPTDGSAELTMADHHYKGTLLVLDIESIKITDRVPQIEKRLAELKKQYDLEFEKTSTEVNARMGIVLNEARQYRGMDPVGISSKIEALVGRYNEELEQEERNDIYDQLKGHNAFMRKATKNQSRVSAGNNK